MGVILRTSVDGETISMSRYADREDAVNSLKTQFPEEWEEFKTLDSEPVFISYLEQEYWIFTEIEEETVTSAIEDLIVGDMAIKVAAMHAVAALKDPEEVAKKLLEEAEEDIAAAVTEAKDMLENKLLEYLERMLKDE